MRTIGLALVALFTFWASVQAQIAAPRLNPLPLNINAPWNPAVYSWDGPSRFGGAFASSSLDFTAQGSSEVEAATGDGNAAQFRYVGESFAFGVDHFSLSLEIIQSFGGGDIELQKTVVGGSYQTGEVFSIGLGQEIGKDSFDVDLEETTLPILGVTVRLGESFFLGLAGGTETVESEDTSVAGSFQEGDRTVTRVGAAYHSRDGENGLHVEAWANLLGTVENAGFTIGERETIGFTLEIVFSNILIGFESTSEESINFVSGAVEEERDGTTISVGWVPLEGLSVVVSINEIEVADLTNNDLIVINGLFAGVTWGF